VIKKIIYVVALSAMMFGENSLDGMMRRRVGVFSGLVPKFSPTVSAAAMWPCFRNQAGPAQGNAGSRQDERANQDPLTWGNKAAVAAYCGMGVFVFGDLCYEDYKKWQEKHEREQLEHDIRMVMSRAAYLSLGGDLYNDESRGLGISSEGLYGVLPQERVHAAVEVLVCRGFDQQLFFDPETGELHKFLSEGLPKAS